MKLADLWHEPYYNPDWSVNPECRLFAGWSHDRIDKYLQSKVNLI